MIAAYSLRLKSEIDDERRRHRAGQRVGELEQDDEGERHQRHLAREEIRERADRGLDDALQRLLAGVGGCRPLRRLSRLGCDQGRRHADQHQHSHGGIARAPGGVAAEPEILEAADQEQRAGGRDQHADAIGRDVGRHAGGLLALVEALDAEGVDHDVLGRRGGGDQKRADRDQPGRGRRIAQAEKHDRRHQQAFARTRASRGGGRASATAPARRAHRPAAPRGISPCRACRPARTARWCRDRRRPRASRRAASSRTAPAAGPPRSRGTERSARAA